MQEAEHNFRNKFNRLSSVYSEGCPKDSDKTDRDYNFSEENDADNSKNSGEIKEKRKQAEKLENEIRAFRNIDDSFKKIVITNDTPTPFYNNEGILMMSIYDFLLDSKSLDF